jgi:hypothetical protein
MVRTRHIAAGIGTAVLLSLSGGQAAWADAPALGTAPLQETGDRDRGEEREGGNDEANERQYDSGEYRGDDDSTRNSDERIVDVDLLNTSPDEKNGDDDK